MHLKRQEVPKNWPIYRKGTKYVVRPEYDAQRGVPFLIVLRDMLKIVQNRKEAKRVIHLRQVLMNNKQVSDEKNSVTLFDTVTLIPSKKHYRMELLDGGKFNLTEIKESEANYKIAKLANKKILKGKKVQLNCEDGMNFISDVKCRINDSVVVNFKDKKVEKCIPLKDGSEVFVFSGKHSGKSGFVKKIYKEKGIAEIDIEGKAISVLIKQFMPTK
jgi:small subunit ribosomal protein S4e